MYNSNNYIQPVFQLKKKNQQKGMNLPSKRPLATWQGSVIALPG